MAALLSESCKKALDAAALNLGDLKVDDEGKKLEFVTEDLKFEFDLEKGTLENKGKAPKRRAGGARGRAAEGQRERREQERSGSGERGGGRGGRDYRVFAPDEKSYVFAKGFDIFYIEGTEAEPKAVEAAVTPNGEGAKVADAVVTGKSNGDAVEDVTKTEEKTEEKTEKGDGIQVEGGGSAAATQAEGTDDQPAKKKVEMELS